VAKSLHVLATSSSPAAWTRARNMRALSFANSCSFRSLKAGFTISNGLPCSRVSEVALTIEAEPQFGAP
jgi:hypothetical protein